MIIDLFKRNDTVSPGKISQLNPDHTNRVQLSIKLKEVFKTIKMENNKTAEKWKKNRENDNDMQEGIPKFNIVRSNKKYGNRGERVETTMLKLYV